MSRLPRRAFRVLMLACCSLFAGCGGNQSALDPAGPGAARIGDVWWLMLLVCAAVWAAVMAALLWAITRRGRRRSTRPRRRHTATPGASDVWPR